MLNMACMKGRYFSMTIKNFSSGLKIISNKIREKCIDFTWTSFNEELQSKNLGKAYLVIFFTLTKRMGPREEWEEVSKLLSFLLLTIIKIQQNAWPLGLGDL